MNNAERELLRTILQVRCCKITWEMMLHIWPNDEPNDDVDAIKVFAGLPDPKTTWQKFLSFCHEFGLEYKWYPREMRVAIWLEIVDKETLHRREIDKLEEWWNRNA